MRVVGCFWASDFAPATARLLFRGGGLGVVAAGLPLPGGGLRGGRLRSWLPDRGRRRAR